MENGASFLFRIMSNCRSNCMKSLPPLVNEGGGLVCESVGKADLLSDHFDSEQSKEAVDLPLT